MACERVRGPQAYDGNHTKTLSQMKAKCSSDVSAGCEWECINNAVDVNTTSELLQPQPSTLHLQLYTQHPATSPRMVMRFCRTFAVCRLPFGSSQLALECNFSN